MAMSQPLITERGFVNARSHQVTPVGGTSEQEIRAAHAKLGATFRSGRTKSYEWRREQLLGLRRLCLENSDDICAALYEDLGRPKMEAFLGDVTSVVGEIDHMLSHLKSWMAPEKVHTGLLQLPARSVVLREPKGVVLQLSPWNFPFNLSLAGICAAMAAGNCVLLKPSEISPMSERLLKDLLPRYLDPDAISVVTGGVAESTLLLELRWDHILYTGNGAVARIVQRAAAQHLTPCTLELGGKSPSVVLPGANIPQAARRMLAWKCFNAGQICTSPDYALVHKDVEPELVAECQKALKEFYGADAKESPSFGRIINQNHFRRIKELISTSGGEILPQQGQMDEASKFIPPTLVRGPRLDSPLMQEEIFGPVLPIIKFDSLDAIVEHINANEKPLAMYLFGHEAQADEIISRTSSGAVCVNDTMFQMANPELPFGGVGGSGMGRYHGKWGFDEFSHVRAIMYRKTWIDLAARYPPYTDGNMKLFERLMVGPLVPVALVKAFMAIGGAAVAGRAAVYVAQSRL